MKLNRNQLRKMILQEMASYTYDAPRAGGSGWKKDKYSGGRRDSHAEDEYIETPEELRRKEIQAKLNAQAEKDISAVMANLYLDARWKRLIKQKMNQHGWIVDFSLDDFTITFQGKKSSQSEDGYNNFVWDLDGEFPGSSDYEGRN